jgi:hypothetical protein
MLRGGVIIFACLESKLFLGKQVFRHQILGIFICFLGFVMVGVASLIHKTDLTSKFSSAESGSAQTIMGLVMILISIMIQATQFVVEEKILETYEISPMRMVGVGIFWIVNKKIRGYVRYRLLFCFYDGVYVFGLPGHYHVRYDREYGESDSCHAGNGQQWDSVVLVLCDNYFNYAVQPVRSDADQKCQRCLPSILGRDPHNLNLDFQSTFGVGGLCPSSLRDPSGRVCVFALRQFHLQ